MNVFALLATIPTTLAQFLLNPNSPVGRMVIYQNNAMVPNAVPDIPVLVELRKKGMMSEAEYNRYAEVYGLDKLESDRVYSIAVNYMSLMDYITLFRRGEIDRPVLDEHAKRIGYDPGVLDQAIKASEFFPSPGDLIRFAVREVYTPETAEKFGMFEDLPDKFLSESSKAGLQQEQAKNYWAAHWELPSTLQGFEMFHRRVIDKDTLSLLLKSLDVMPFWRDKLTEISYNPLTRVDVRRMYGLGVLDETGVYNSYLDSGYSPKNAKLMTEFTVAFENNEYDGITRSNILKAYKNNLIDRTELMGFLDGFGYSQTVIEFWIEQADFEKTEARIKLIEDDVIELYRSGAITAEGIQERLLKEDLPAAFVNTVVNNAILQEGKRRKLPSKEDLTDWLNKQVIDDREYTTKMRIRGYRDDDIINYLSEIALDQNTEKRKYLGIKTYSRWLTEGILDEKAFREIAGGMEINPADIDRLTTEAIAARTAE